MLDDLLELTGSPDFHEYGTIDLAEARIAGDVLSLYLNVYLGGEDVQSELWEIECVSVLEHQLLLGACSTVDVYFDHVLLWPYIEARASVSFHSDNADPLPIVGGLYQEQQKLVAPWIPFGRFMNGNPINLISGRYGMLADGPIPLVEAYLKVLQQFGIDAALTEPKPAVYTNDQEAGITEVEVLILDTGKYVVAEKFNATRLEEGDGV
jgi:hypothetical protein